METVSSDTYGASLIGPEAEQILNDFGADLMPTVLQIIAIVIPTALALWALGFGIKKGINYLQRRANRSI